MLSGSYCCLACYAIPVATAVWQSQGREAMLGRRLELLVEAPHLFLHALYLLHNKGNTVLACMCLKSCSTIV